MDLYDSIERLRQFSQLWNDEDVVDKASGLTGAEIRLVVEHSFALPRHPPDSGDAN